MKTARKSSVLTYDLSAVNGPLIDFTNNDDY